MSRGAHIETQGESIIKITISEKTLDVNQISISAKCSDLCVSELKNNGTVVAEHNGYVPALMPGKHYGDYVILDIDMNTGMILNWKKPTPEVVEKTDWVLQ